MELGSPAMTLGLKGVRVRNTFLEFQDAAAEELLSEHGFGRQCSEPVKSNWARQISELTTAGSAGEQQQLGELFAEESGTDFEDPLSVFPQSGLLPRGLDASMLSPNMENALQATYQALLGTQAVASSIMQYCPECGNKADPGHRFCPFCCYALHQPPPAATMPAVSMLDALERSEAAVGRAASVIAGAAAESMSQVDTRRQYPRSDVSAAVPVEPSRTSKASGTKATVLSSLGRFRYVEASQLDVELASTLCLSHMISTKIDAPMRP